MKNLLVVTLISLMFLSPSVYSNDPDWDKIWEIPDWSKDAMLGARSNRKNIYQLPDALFKDVVARGRMHALIYPVESQKVRLPFRALEKFLDSKNTNPLKKLVLSLLKVQTGWNTLEQLYSFIGLHDYPQVEGSGVYHIPFKDGSRPDYPMGVTIRDTKQGEMMTVGCAGCHTGNLFGKKILGMTNRFPRANDIFLMGKKYVPLVPNALFKLGTGSNKAETEAFKELKKNLQYIEGVEPQVLGLDTSLAHTGLSLTHRLPDEWGTKHPYRAKIPRMSQLRKKIADSKPAVWWTTKYKTKFLADASVRSGNPVFTNFLWNELGRSQDLKYLEKWFKGNKKTIIELTAAVFANEAPRMTDFFDIARFDIEGAKRGQKLFNKSCRKCHGTYIKGWDLKDAGSMSNLELVETAKVKYHQQTKVEDVGTSDLRRKGMAYFQDDLNRLKLSKDMNTVVEEQAGYVPPVLVGIWARWPYFHNNSIPSLCALLTPENERPEGFWMGEANDKDLDFDFACNGYPLGKNTPDIWKKNKAYYYNTKKEGLSNRGHTQDILIRKDGTRVFSDHDVKDLVSFLQTL